MKRCSALDANGKRCHARRHLKLVKYHGDGELYPWYDDPPKEPGWVVVPLCSKHRKSKESK